jgi:predicted dehydrogenase
MPGLSREAVGAPIPVGLVGAGKHGERYVRHIVEDVPELRLRLLCRRDAIVGREQAERAGARFVAEFLELVASSEIEAVVVAVPPALHREICEAAARAGKAILLEKPLATTRSEGLAIRDAIAEAGVPFMVAHTLRFNSVVRAVREEIAALGTLHQVCLSQRFEPSPLAWLDDPRVSGGGNILHTGVHSFDLLRFFAGADPSSVVARTRRLVTRQTEDSFVALFSFPTPLLGSVTGSRATASRSGTIEIAGEHGQIHADHVHGWGVRLHGTRSEPLIVASPVPTVRETLHAFARAIRDGEPPPITLTDGLWAVSMAEACYRSATSTREAEIEPS